MKIAFDAKRFFQNGSGLGNYSRDLVRILATFYPENKYFLLNSEKTERGRNVLELPDVYYVETSKGKFSRQLKMGKDAQKIDADIFHGLSGELPIKWRKTSIGRVVTIHDLIFLRLPQYYSFFDRKIHFWKFKKAAKQANKIIAISEQTKKDIVHYLKVPAEKIQVVYQGCHQSFKEIPSENFQHSVKGKFDLPDRFILNVGTVEPRKNLLNIIKSLKDTAIPLVVVGKKQKKYFSKIEKELKRNKGQVQFLENVSMEELAVIYRLADIFVYPSSFEGFGIPVIEALFSGTAVITSNVSSLPEAGGPGALYVNPENIQDLRSKILHLWENEAERNRRSEVGLLYAQKHFTDEKIASDLMNVYLSVLE